MNPQFRIRVTPRGQAVRSTLTCREELAASTNACVSPRHHCRYCHATRSVVVHLWILTDCYVGFTMTYTGYTLSRNLRYRYLVNLHCVAFLRFVKIGIL